MSKKIERRYMVVKLSDIDRYLTVSDRHHLHTMGGVIERKRKEEGRVPLAGLFVDRSFPVHDRVEEIMLHWLNGGGSPDDALLNHVDKLEEKVASLEQQRDAAQDENFQLVTRNKILEEELAAIRRLLNGGA